MAVGFTAVGDVERPPRVIVISNEGGILIVDITDYNILHVGTWTVVADLSAVRIQGMRSVIDESAVYPMFVPPDYTRIGDSTVQRRRDGILVAAGDHFIVIGKDGSAKYFDSECAIGTGYSVGQNLRARRPYSGGSTQSSSIRKLESEESFEDSENTNPVRNYV
jgi:hypothetical protein